MKKITVVGIFHNLSDLSSISCSTAPVPELLEEPELMTVWDNGPESALLLKHSAPQKFLDTELCCS